MDVFTEKPADCWANLISSLVTHIGTFNANITLELCSSSLRSYKTCPLLVARITRHESFASVTTATTKANKKKFHFKLRTEVKTARQIFDYTQSLWRTRLKKNTFGDRKIIIVLCITATWMKIAYAQQSFILWSICGWTLPPALW